jgi:hypothetical protein
MRSFLLLPLFILASLFAEAQVGISTAKPKADLHIVANSTPGVDNYNGIIIPKVTVLPLTGAPEFPEIEQAGLLIYLNSSDATKGIYIFDGVQYVKLEPASAAGAFYNNGTTDFATTTTASVQREGNLSIGSDLNTGKLNVKIEGEDDLADRVAVKVINNNRSTANQTTSGIDVVNSSKTTGEKIGIKSRVKGGTSNGTHIGIALDNEVFDGAGVSSNYGLKSVVGSTSSVSAESFGLYSQIGSATARGTNYAVYGYSVHDISTTDFSYSGYFRGDRFAIRSEDEVTGYNLTVSTGAAGQVLTSNGDKTTSWIEVDGSITNEGSLLVLTGGVNDSQINSNTNNSTNITIAGGNGIQVTETGNTITVATSNTVNESINTINGGSSGAATPVGDSYYVRLNPASGSQEFILPDPTTVPGRTYVLYNINSTITAEIYRAGDTTLGNRFQASNSITPIENLTLNPNDSTKTIQVFSDGVNWVYGSWGF